MTIGLTNRNDAVGNDTATEFPYSFKIFAATQLEVKVKKTSDGTITTLTYPTHYTVSGVGVAAGGNVTLTDVDGVWQNASDGTLKTGYTIATRRVVAVRQGTDVRNQGGFFPDVHEDEFDYLTMIDQQQQDDLDRAVKLDSAYATADFDMTLPAPVASSAIGFNAAGDGLAIISSLAGVATTAFTQTLLDDASAAAARATLGVEAAGTGVLENFIPNSAFQINTGLAAVTKMNAASTAVMSAINVSAYTTAANLVTCTCANTAELKDGDLVTFSAAADTNLKLSALRVSSLVANTSFQVRIPFGLTAAASAACTVTPKSIGDYTAAAGGAGPDGWGKTAALDVWVEDGAVNLTTGMKRSMGLRKDGAGAEVFYWTLPTADVTRFRGQNVVFGMWVYHKVKGGAGTFRLYLNNGAVTYSASGASAGSWEWLSVTIAVGTSATTLDGGISMDGAANDVYFVGSPMACIGTALVSGAYKPITRELLIPRVGPVFSALVNASITFPVAADAAGTYSFIYDPYADSAGAIAPDVKQFDALAEGINNNAVVTGSALIRAIVFRDSLAAPIKYGAVCPQYVQNVKSFASGSVLLDSSGLCVIYSGVSADSWTNDSIDVSRFQLN